MLDLFCGLGNFSLPLARRAGEVVGVEGDAGLVRGRARNAARNGIANVEFHVADLFARRDGACRGRRRRYDRVLLDPPRAGAREILPVVAGSGAGRVVYISCHPGSLARDAGLLVREHGFRLDGGRCHGHVPAHDPRRGHGGVRPLRHAMQRGDGARGGEADDARSADGRRRRHAS